MNRKSPDVCSIISIDGLGRIQRKLIYHKNAGGYDVRE